MCVDNQTKQPCLFDRKKENKVSDRDKERERDRERQRERQRDREREREAEREREKQMGKETEQKELILKKQRKEKNFQTKNSM